MRIIRQTRHFLLLLATVLLAACAKTENGDVEYVPFQESDDGQWGLISMDGKVLCSNEFKNKPTIVRDGRLFVRSQRGVWEMYEASEKPKKIGKDYMHTSGFRNGVALVAEKGKPVSIIDPNGNTVKLLDKIEGKEVEGVYAFQHNYTTFMTTDSLMGAIDNRGNCVIKPEYSFLNTCGEDKFIGIHDKYKQYIKKEQKDKVTFSILDSGGKTLFNISGNKYENISGVFTDGLMAVSIKKDGKEICGLINDKGETVVNPSDKFKNIGTIKGENFTYYNGDGWGLMTTKGETLIRAKYESLYYDEEGILIAGVKNGETLTYKYIDEKDNQIGNDTYVRAMFFSTFDGDHTLVKPNDKLYSIIDKKGKQLEGLPDMVDVSTFEGESYIESDYVDMQKMVAGFNISINGVAGVSTSTSPKEAVQLSVQTGWATGTKEHPAGSAYWYDYKTDTDFHKVSEGVYGYITVFFPGNMSRQTYRTERVIDYAFEDWYWYHDNKIPTGYAWNKVYPNMFSLRIYNTGRMQGKLRDLFNTLVAKFKQWGSVAKQNDGAVVVELRGGKRALIAMEKDNVTVLWGKLKPASQLDISQYKNVSEEDNQTSSNYNYLNAIFPDEMPEEDASAADSTLVDSVAAAY